MSQRFTRSFFSFNVLLHQHQKDIIRECDSSRCYTAIILQNNHNEDEVNQRIAKFNVLANNLKNTLKNEETVELLLNVYRLGHDDGFRLGQNDTD